MTSTVASTVYLAISPYYLFIIEIVHKVHTHRKKMKKNEKVTNQCKQPQQYNPTHANPITAKTFDSSGLEEVHEQCSLRLEPNQVKNHTHNEKQNLCLWYEYCTMKGQQYCSV